MSVRVRRTMNFSEFALVSSSLSFTRRSWPYRGPQNNPDDFSGELSAFRLQTRLRCHFVLLDGCSRLFNLGLRPVPRLGDGCSPHLQRLLT
jgi:hypothetical protein